MKLGNILLLLGCALVGATMFAVLPAVAQEKPNVVFILADNVGYGDLGSYGGGELRGAPTPRLDALAHEGLRFTQFLVEPACTPSRAALMTGQYSIRNGLSLIAIEGSPYTLSGARLHDGRTVQGRWLRHRNLRKMALGKRAAKPADRAWLRRVLWHSAGHYMGCGNIRRHDRADALDSMSPYDALLSWAADR